MLKRKKALVFLSTFVVIALWSAAAFAAEPAAADNIYTMFGMLAIGAGLGVGIAAFGGAIGMGRAAGEALGGIARNPGAAGKIFTPFIIALALIEALAIYAFLISILLVLGVGSSGELVTQAIEMMG